MSPRTLELRATSSRSRCVYSGGEWIGYVEADGLHWVAWARLSELTPLGRVFLSDADAAAAISRAYRVRNVA